MLPALFIGGLVESVRPAWAWRSSHMTKGGRLEFSVARRSLCA